MKKLYFLAILFSLVSFLKGQTIHPDPNYTTSFGTVGSFIPYLSKTGEIYKVTADYKLHRYLTNRNLDTNFGVNGYLTLLPESKNAIEVTESGIYTFPYNIQSLNKIVKYTLSGSVDSSFGSNGISEELFPINSGDSAQKIIVNSDQSIYVLITGNRIKKILPNGTIDTNFGTKTFNDNALLLKSNDNSLLIKYKNLNTNTDVITKYTAQGNLDTSFGNQGELSITIPAGFLNIYTNNLNEFFVLSISSPSLINTITKYNTNGIDSNFGNNGSLNITYSDFISCLGLRIGKIDFDSNNNIILFGIADYSLGFNEVNVFKYNVNGTPDHTFNINKNYFRGTGESNIPYRDYKVIDNNTFMFFSIRSIVAGMQDLRVFRYLRNQSLNVFESYTKKEIEIYPNPVSDFLQIKLDLNEKLQKINVYSLDGKLILSSTNIKNNLQHLSSGNYIIEVITNKNKYKEKILKK